MQKQFTPNPFRIDGDSAYIQLFNRQGASIAEAIVDTEDVQRVIGAHRWYAHWDSANSRYYVRAKNGTVHLHRFVMDAPEDLFVDHIEHDTLDCRKKSLRSCTRSQNGLNRKGPQAGNSSGFRNVHWDPIRCMWRVEVRVMGKKYFIGRFDDIDEAVIASIEARKRYHGEFAT